MLISSRRAGALAAAFLTLTPLFAQEKPAPVSVYPPAPVEAPAPPATPAPAETPTPPPKSEKTELKAPSGDFDESIFDGKPVHRITLQQAIEMALLNNLEVRFERMGIASARAQVRLAQGAFDPAFFMTGQYQRNKRAQDINNPSTTQAVQNQQTLATQLNSAALQLNAETINQNAQIVQTAQAQQLTLQQQQAFINQQRIAQGLAPINLPGIGNVTPLLLEQGAITTPILNDIIVFDQRSIQFQTGIQGRSSIGTRYSLQATVAQNRNTFEGDINPVENLYETFVGVNVQQPLLKNFGKDANLLDLRTAQIQAKVQTYTWKQNIATAVQGVMSAYYDMLYALNDINVRQAAMAADTSLVELYRRRVELGFNSPFDIRQAEAAVSADREQLLASKFNFLDRQFTLKRLISAKSGMDTRLYIPADAPNLNVRTLQRSPLLLAAYRSRWDYQATLLGADLQNVRVRYARNQLLPQLDLIASYGLNGLGRSFDQSFDAAGSFNTPSYSAGFQFVVPIGNRQPRAQYDAINAQREQALLRVKRSELDIETDVDTVIARIQTNRQRLDAARQTRELNEEAVRIGYRRLEEGLVSAYDITEQQRKLYDAKSRELAALADVNKAITQLWLVTGTVLDVEAIGFEEPVEPSKPDKAMAGKVLPDAVILHSRGPAKSVVPAATPSPTPAPKHWWKR
jgi:outer membrane protein TolC